MASSRIVRAALVGLDGFTPLTALGGAARSPQGSKGAAFPPSCCVARRSGATWGPLRFIYLRLKG